jgi:two-component system response regulator AtoC
MAIPLAEHVVGPLPPEITIFGRSKVMRAVRETVDKVAETNLPILISGQSGTGKEVIAKFIHCRSPWREAPFVKVSCPDLRAQLLENDHFGFEKGTFAGVRRTSSGRVDLTHGGTLFLDEIAELASPLQTELLNLLGDGQFCPVEGHEDREVKARIICATNRNLEKEIEAGNFRRDLYYRLNVVRVDLPSLRQRSADIPLILNYFLGVYSERYNRARFPISPALLGMLKRCDWPGNILQLENLIKRYVILGSEDALTAELLQCSVRHNDLTLPIGRPIPLKSLTRQAAQDFERKIILQELETYHWKRKEVARALRISYGALLNKMRNAGLLAKKRKPPGRLKGETGKLV